MPIDEYIKVLNNAVSAMMFALENSFPGISDIKYMHGDCEVNLHERMVLGLCMELMITGVAKQIEN